MASFEPTAEDSVSDIDNEFENIFGDESGDDEDFMGFTAEDVAEIQRAYEEDNVEDLLEGEDLNPTNFNLHEIPWSCVDASEVTVPEFREPVGPTKKLPRDATPLDFLNLLFTVELMTTIVENTNIFANCVGLANSKFSKAGSIGRFVLKLQQF